MKSVGIIGYGQLGRMLMIHGLPLDIRFHFWDPRTDVYLQGIPPEAIPIGTGEEGFQAFLKAVDYITFETENVPAEILTNLPPDKAIYPGLNALAICQNRLKEKKLCQTLSIPVAPFLEIHSETDLYRAFDMFQHAVIVKTATMGYDGKGQYLITDSKEIPTIWQTLKDQPLIAEQRLEFDFECSLIAARNQLGQTIFYPLIRNKHASGILAISSLSTAFDMSFLQKQAEEYAARLLDDLNYQGLLTIEFFVTNSGQLLVNELAPRVHNSGHLTIEGFDYNQFEQHIRAVLNLPLQMPQQQYSEIAMINCVGRVMNISEILCYPGTHFHWYGKTVQPKRKVGHVTIASQDRVQFLDTLEAIKTLILPF